MNIDWGTFLLSIPLSLLILGGFAKFFINSYINGFFNKKLEKHKSDLQLLIENNRFDLQRKMADFNLYTNKKHEAYMKIYDLFLIAEGHVRSFMGVKKMPDYNEYGLEDIEKKLRSYNLLEKVIQDFLAKWRSTFGSPRQELHKEINDYLAMIDIQKSWIKIEEANNYFLINRIYLSDQIEDTLSSVVSLLSSYLNGVEFLLVNRIPFLGSENLSVEIENMINRMKEQMKKELQVGYYQ
ncbi:hypothetical protein [Cohnella abietis]|uniref:Uncharacterized protein n=1 Tax=Cohnella abietis TaxID=2507935 RepID=A0A3T1D7P5_9BACL|nr:hypothetical protein [Cohnella abietis]BBI34075.1 hypothetical protein KCTCHS21_34740 [Cohnella abietis]